MVFYECKCTTNFKSVLVRLLSMFCIVVVFVLFPFYNNHGVEGLSYESSDNSYHIIEFVPLKYEATSGKVDASSNTSQDYSNRNRTLNVSNSEASRRSNNTTISYNDVDKENDTDAMENEKGIHRSRCKNTQTCFEN